MLRLISNIYIFSHHFDQWLQDNLHKEGEKMFCGLLKTVQDKKGAVATGEGRQVEKKLGKLKINIACG